MVTNCGSSDDWDMQEVPARYTLRRTLGEETPRGAYTGLPKLFVEHLHGQITRDIVKVLPGNHVSWFFYQRRQI